MSTISLVEANLQRAKLIAEVLAPRIPEASHPWKGYTANEPLDGVLEKVNEISYRRRTNPGAFLYMGFLTMRDIQEEHRSTPTILKNNPETYEFDVDFKQPIHYKETVEHQWAKTTSFAEAAKKAWEVAAKASLSIKYAGIGASLEVSGKYGEELSRSSSGSSSESDRVQKELEFTGPVKFRLKAERSVNRESVLIRARTDFEFKLYFNTYEWFQYHGVFIPAVKGLAPRYPEGSIFASSSPSTYQMFHDHPVPDAIVEELMKPSGMSVEFVVEYDNVVTQSLETV